MGWGGFCGDGGYIYGLRVGSGRRWLGTYVGLELGLGWVGGIADGKVKLEVWGGWAVFEKWQQDQLW